MKFFGFESCFPEKITHIVAVRCVNENLIAKISQGVLAKFLGGF